MFETRDMSHDQSIPSLGHGAQGTRRKPWYLDMLPSPPSRDLVLLQAFNCFNFILTLVDCIDL